MACNCIGGNPCPCQRGLFMYPWQMGQITFGPVHWPSGAAQPPAAAFVDLLAKAKAHVMTPKEIYDQKVSFIWGMLPEESTTTKEEIKRHLAEMGVVDPGLEQDTSGCSRCVRRVGGALTCGAADCPLEMGMRRVEPQ